jgi:NhaA family Na+:H+ antiporter
VSLLIGELAFGIGSDLDDRAKIAVLTGSLLAALLAAVVLRLRNRTYRRIHEAETTDRDRDGIPDAFDPHPDRAGGSTGDGAAGVTRARPGRSR